MFGRRLGRGVPRAVLIEGVFGRENLLEFGERCSAEEREEDERTEKRGFCGFACAYAMGRGAQEALMAACSLFSSADPPHLVTQAHTTHPEKWTRTLSPFLPSPLHTLLTQWSPIPLGICRTISTPPSSRAVLQMSPYTYLAPGKPCTNCIESF